MCYIPTCRAHIVPFITARSFDTLQLAESIWWHRNLRSYTLSCRAIAIRRCRVLCSQLFSLGAPREEKKNAQLTGKLGNIHEHRDNHFVELCRNYQWRQPNFWRRRKQVEYVIPWLWWKEHFCRVLDRWREEVDWAPDAGAERSTTKRRGGGLAWLCCISVPQLCAACGTVADWSMSRATKQRSKEASP